MKKKTAWIIGIVVAVVAVGAVAWAMLSGALSVSWNGFGSKYANVASVCGGDLIDTYNKASNYEERNGENEPPTVDIEGLKGIASQIKGVNGYENDPTCQAMLFWIAVESKEAGPAEQALAKIKELHDLNAFPDNNLRTTVALFNYDAALEYVKNPPEPATGIVE